MTRVLVTGGTGFVGGALCSLLRADGHDVTALVRPGAATERLERLGVRIVPVVSSADVRRIAMDVRPETVFHVAAYFSRHPAGSELDRYIDANISLGTHLLEGLEPGTVFVLVSSYFQYRGGKPHPHSIYAATKQAFVEIGAYYRALRGIDVREVVLFDNYGPDDTRDKLVPQLAAALAGEGRIDLGPSRQRIDLLHVDDVARGIAAAAVPGNPAVMVVRAESLVTVGDIAKFAQSAGRLEVNFNESRSPSDLAESPVPWPAPRGWSPARPLAEGLRELFDLGA